jgi:hypothetical protein
MGTKANCLPATLFTYTPPNPKGSHFFLASSRLCLPRETVFVFVSPGREKKPKHHF